MTTTNLHHRSHATDAMGDDATDALLPGSRSPLHAGCSLTSGGMRIGITRSGAVSFVRVGDIQVSQYEPGPHDAPISGLWLRRRQGGRIDSLRLIGSCASADWRIRDGQVVWQGRGLGVAWSVKLSMAGTEHGGRWVWHVEVSPAASSESMHEPASCVVSGSDVAGDGGHADGPASDAADVTWDLVSAQDLALAPTEQALSSEPYISQYIAYHVEKTADVGDVLAARQTMADAPRLTLLTTGIAQGCAAYLTDGFDFYGRETRRGCPPRALADPDWDGGHINQYEFGMACLLSTPRPLGAGLTWDVWSSFRSDFRGQLDDACLDDSRTALRLLADSAYGDDYECAGDEGAHGDIQCRSDGNEPVSLMACAPVLNGNELSDEEFLALGNGDVTNVERAGTRQSAANRPLTSATSTDGESMARVSPRGVQGTGRVLSYFSTHARHIVSQAKELEVDRSHGQILLAGGHADPEPTLAATTYAPGVFASHLVLGNTNMNRLVSVHRTSLNLARSQGVRILVRTGGAWRILGVPSAYVMDVGGSAWLYRMDGICLEVTTTAGATDNTIAVEMKASRPIDAMMTIDIENPGNWRVDEDGTAAVDERHSVVIAPRADCAAGRHCPGLRYSFESTDAMLSGDDLLFRTREAGPQERTGGRNTGMLVFRADASTHMRVVMAASMAGSDEARRISRAEVLAVSSREETLARHYRCVCSFARGFEVHGGQGLEEFNVIMPWFVQNAQVHFLSPHGLEQYSGAAWGTRDVCQGPFELALAFGHDDIARSIVLKVFAHQNTDGSLPQWFMFDEYAYLYQKDSHGDIPVWPLMAIGEYLDASGDESILDEHVGFWDRDTDRPCDGESTVLDHLERTISYIRSHRVPGTRLFSYGEGDWDDTLQPARESMKKEMASTWTIALLYQASAALARLLDSAGSTKLASEFGDEASLIRSVFAEDFVFDGVLAGYVSFSHGEPRPIIHPDDTRTGIQYRLISMTRSIIAGLLSPESERRHERIVNENLHYPDGMRLMNRPAAFHDGVTSVFKRAEQSANVGREIGLMYTHAHIRYCEALALLGRDTLGEELLRISPVGQFSRLSTSEPRQRNCYFASSDADFPDRYTAARQWDRLRAGSPHPVGVRGGWRVYSSGPGIYIRQTVQHLFGVQIHADSVVFDPVLSTHDDGVTLRMALFGRMRTLRYHVVPGGLPVEVSVHGERILGDEIPLPYRTGGVRVSSGALGSADIIDITVGCDRGPHESK